MKKSLVVVLGALSTAIAGCGSLSHSGAVAQGPKRPVLVGTRSGASEVAAKDTILVARTVRSPAGLSESEAHFVLYSTSFDTCGGMNSGE